MKIYFTIEEMRCGKVLSEIVCGKDHLFGYTGYILDPNQKLFTQSALDEGLISLKNIRKIRMRVTEVMPTYEEVKQILKNKGATHCINCKRTIDNCVDYESCEEIRLK